MSKKQVVKQYETACENVRKTFTATYFHDCEPENDDYHWVTDTVGDVCLIFDYYVSMSDMVTALRLEVPEDVFFAWYEQAITDDKPINLNSWEMIHKNIPTCIHGKHVSQFIRCNECNCLSLCCDREVALAKPDCKEGETNYFICTHCKKPC